mmetsp:Transcript_13411/g.14729  ORF Transcript_13411/g.14729 Transcript_13411/m.14729 type:complete len:83 (+) Transcript_13411:529-777(+)
MPFFLDPDFLSSSFPVTTMKWKHTTRYYMSTVLSRFFVSISWNYLPHFEISILSVCYAKNSMYFKLIITKDHDNKQQYQQQR